MNKKKKICWGILGTGNISRQFAQGLSLLTDAQLIAIASRNLESAQAFAHQFKVKYAYQSYKELVENPEVDVVYIATPNAKHREHALLCLNANKAIVCEKPFATNFKEAMEVIALARAKHIFCMEAMWMRFQPLVREVRVMISNGAVGTPTVLTVNFGVSAKSDSRKNVFKPEMGGGALLDLGVYGLSLAVYLFGSPSDVCGRLVMGTSGVDQTASVVLNYPDGRTVSIIASLFSNLSNEAIISGNKGRIRICDPFFRPHKINIFKQDEINTEPRASSNVLSSLKDKQWVKQIYWGLLQCFPFIKRSFEYELVRFFDGNGFNYEAREVMDCLKKGVCESSIMPLDDTLKVMEIIDRVRKQNNSQYKGNL